MEKYKVTSFCAPPTIYRFMIREDLSKYDLSSLQYCCTAGEALNPAVYDKFYEKTGIRMMEGFGQTETTMTLGTFPWMTPKPGSMGIPNAQYDIDLLRADGTSCEDGEKGEIVVRVGDKKPIGLFKGYYRDDEKTREAWHDGIYHTGDMAWRDEDGYYWFEGRIDDVIKSSPTLPLWSVPSRGCPTTSVVWWSRLPSYSARSGRTKLARISSRSSSSTSRKRLHLTNTLVSLNSLMSCPKPYRARLEE